VVGGVCNQTRFIDQADLEHPAARDQARPAHATPTVTEDVDPPDGIVLDHLIQHLVHLLDPILRCKALGDRDPDHREPALKRDTRILWPGRAQILQLLVVQTADDGPDPDRMRATQVRLEISTDRRAMVPSRLPLCSRLIHPHFLPRTR